MKEDSADDLSKNENSDSTNKRSSQVSRRAFLGNIATVSIVTTTNSEPATITKVFLAGNEATITTAAPHGFLAGQTVTIAGLSLPNAFFDGTYQLTAVTATSFSYTLFHANVAASLFASRFLRETSAPLQIAIIFGIAVLVALITAKLGAAAAWLGTALVLSAFAGASAWASTSTK